MIFHCRLGRDRYIVEATSERDAKDLVFAEMQKNPRRFASGETPSITYGGYGMVYIGTDAPPGGWRGGDC